MFHEGSIISSNGSYSNDSKRKWDSQITDTTFLKKDMLMKNIVAIKKNHTDSLNNYHPNINLTLIPKCLLTPKLSKKMEISKLLFIGKVPNYSNNFSQTSQISIQKKFSEICTKTIFRRSLFKVKMGCSFHLKQKL